MFFSKFGGCLHSYQCVLLPIMEVPHINDIHTPSAREVRYFLWYGYFHNRLGSNMLSARNKIDSIDIF